MTGNAKYTVTQSDIDKGTITNTADVKAVSVTGKDVTATDKVDVTTESNPGITLKKTTASYGKL